MQIISFSFLCCWSLFSKIFIHLDLAPPYNFNFTFPDSSPLMERIIELWVRKTGLSFTTTDVKYSSKETAEDYARWAYEQKKDFIDEYYPGGKNAWLDNSIGIWSVEVKSSICTYPIDITIHNSSIFYGTFASPSGRPSANPYILESLAVVLKLLGGKRKGNTTSEEVEFPTFEWASLPWGHTNIPKIFSSYSKIIDHEFEQYRKYVYLMGGEDLTKKEKDILYEYYQKAIKAFEAQYE